jgi:acetylornithine deacetylase/succinyl-diaminopimelate desuccinylase-like protein
MVDDARDEVIALTQELVRIPTVNDGTPQSGYELAAAEFVQRSLAQDGIESRIFRSAEHRGNIVASIGTGSGPRLLYMSHLDVVPVEDESQWTHPPFSGEIAEGRIWGRGAADMKSTVAAQAMALKLLQRAGVRLGGTLALASCADEEAGGAVGFGWMAQHHPELLRADYAINEGGGWPIRSSGRLVYPIPTGEKGRLEAHLRIKGRGWHASQPWRADNAIYTAEEVIRRIRTYQPEVSTAHELFRHLHVLAGIEHPVSAETLDAALQEIEARDVNLASMLRAASRMTIVATMIHGGVKSNSVAERCVVTCDVRTLPWQDRAYVQRALERQLTGLDGVTVELVETAVSNQSPYDHPFRTLVERATRDALGRDDLAFVPGLTVGFTDSRFVRPFGNVTYGFVPSHPEDDPSKSGAHNIDESAGIESLLTATRFHVALAVRALGEV